MARTDPRLERLIERILEREPADDAAFELRDADSREAEALRTVADIARTFRGFGAPMRAPALFTWGPLAVQEKVAGGASSEVFRALDPALGLAVALKLRREHDDAPRARVFLDEARRLAKVQHRNVVRVFGAGVHDGRAGLWCEWIEGRSLAEQVAADGPLGGAETVVVGIALCHALAAVHAAGLLHGDVKPANVMRERGGRIVLTDLGAGGEPEHVNAALRSAATPAWLAPEVMRGALRTPQHDLYALGGLLQFLLDGRTPDPDRPGLASDRRDLSPALREVIARARDADPTKRFADAAAMERALAACLGDRVAPVAPRVIPRRAFAIGAFATLLAIAAAFRFGAPAHAPEATLELLLQREASVAPVDDGTPVALGDRLAFAITSREPVWLYAFNADGAGVLTRLFPLAGLDTSNPLPAGRTEIPGRIDGRSLRFEVSTNAAAEEFLLVAALAPVAPLEALGVAEADIRTRSTDRVVPASPGATDARLDALVAELAGASDLRIWRYRLPHRD